MSKLMHHLNIGDDSFEVMDAAARSGIGSPLMADTAAAMTDNTKIYVYTGSETGYTFGNWYYYNGSAWTSGGVYNSAAINVDDTLSVEGAAADAKAAGDAIEAVDDKVDQKANVDGAYENMTVGNAEQLISSVMTEDKTPYNFRTSGGSIDVGDREIDMLVGGTVAFNQLVQNGNFADTSEWGVVNGSLSVNSNIATITASADGNSSLYRTDYNIPNNHVIVGIATVKGISGKKFVISSVINSQEFTAMGSFQNIGYVEKASTYAAGYPRIVCKALETGDTFDVKYFNLIDLTAMFGTTIADYIYTLESGTAGAGVAWFKKLFPKSYYAYNAGELMSVKTSAHETVGFNAFNSETGIAKLVGGMEYQIAGTYTAVSYSTGETLTIDNDGYFTPSADGVLTVTGGNDTDTCVHLVWDGERDGEFEEYVKHSYALDSDLELRGIPKLDSNNKLYYDGDTYEADGTVTRKYGIVDLGSCTWVVVDNSIGLVRTDNFNNGALCSKYVMTTSAVGSMENMTCRSSVNWFYVCDISFKDKTTTQIKTALEGVKVLQTLATPTTETAEPYANPQIVDDFGTEEYVDSRDVAIPVGHETQYMINLRAKLEMMPNSPDLDGDYMVRHDNGANTYVPLTIPSELPAAPSEDGTYILTVTVADGEATYSWGVQS